MPHPSHRLSSKPSRVDCVFESLSALTGHCDLCVGLGPNRKLSLSVCHVSALELSLSHLTHGHACSSYGTVCSFSSVISHTGPTGHTRHSVRVARPFVWSPFAFIHTALPLAYLLPVNFQFSTLARGRSQSEYRETRVSRALRRSDL